MKNIKFNLILIFILLLISSLNAQSDYKLLNKQNYDGYPDKVWYKYENIHDEGWDLIQLEKARKYFDSLSSATVLTVHNGGIVLAWGDVDKKFMCHSIRKSFLFSLFGIFEEKGLIDLNKTIKNLGIDDKESLTEQEKQATILHLLKCRSGIYHPAAYEAPIMVETRPKRGSHAPDSFYYYNNWDYNVLLTIFEQETRKNLFNEFQKLIAEPIGMEHFQLNDCEYSYDSTKSIHPAYPFVMSTKDLARFGLLYLNNGTWKDKQIIPHKWIIKETTPYSTDWLGYGAGFKWIKPTYSTLQDLGVFYTSGHRGHGLFIIPKLNIVFVHRVDTFTENDMVDQREIEKLLKLILLANKNLLNTDIYNKMKMEIEE
jgi:CubicO group peptidase (beta-lactamase class C family)